MAKSKVALLCVAPAAVLGSSQDRAEVTPVEKVVSLLEGLVSELTAEGTEEATTYDTFACFCKSKTTDLSTSIVTGKGTINSESASVEEKTALQTQAEDDLVAAQKKLGQQKADLEATEADCAKGKAAYDAANADIQKAIGSLVGAISSLENAKPTDGGSGAAGLVTVRANIQKSLAIADAMKLIDDGPKWKQVSAFIQGHQAVNPDDPEFKYHSQGIIDVLTELHTQFTDTKTAADNDETQRAATCTSMINNLNTEIGLSDTAIQGLESQIATYATEIAAHRKNLVEADATLKDDQLFLKDLTERCEARANDWDQRTAQRNDELIALNKGLVILKGTVSAADAAVNLRASLVQHGAQPNRTAPAVVSKEVPSLMQERLVSVHGVQRLGQEQDRAARKAQALAVLREQGRLLSSSALSALSVRAGADPFGKVKDLIQHLIERLIHEATEEVGKKGFCDTNLAQARKDREFRHEEAMSLNSQIHSLEVRRDALAQEITELVDTVADLNVDLSNATTARENEKADNLQALQTAKEGNVAVTEAIMILKSFYKEAAKAVALVQEAKYSPVDETGASAGFEGNYGGKQDAIKGIFGILEVIKSDFDRTMRKTMEAEKEAAASFVKFERTMKADIASKETKLALDREDHETTVSTIDAKMVELQQNMDLVDQALKSIESLKPMCIDSGMSYADRVAKRQEEITALKTAMCILDEDLVEAECQQR